MNSPRNGTAINTDSLAFLRTLDALEQGLAFLDCEGMLRHANRAFTHALEASPEGDRLRQEVQRFTEFLCALTRVQVLPAHEEEIAARDVAAGQEQYRLKGHYFDMDLFGSGSTVLITLERRPPDSLSESALRRRFGLSPQESRVMRLLVEGKMNVEIAHALCLSTHTVRHHIAHIFHKLRVRSRAEVASKVLRG